MGTLSTNFDASEFACKCGCDYYVPNNDLVSVLQYVRTNTGRPVTINSACRCIAHNAEVGGKENSYHVKGMAADIVVEGMSPESVAKILETNFPDCGIGRYDTFTHVDVRGYAARWNNCSTTNS